VLLRLTGDGSVLEQKEAKDIKAKNSKYLLRYSFETVPASDFDNFYSEDYSRSDVSSEYSELTKKSNTQQEAKQNNKILKLNFDHTLLIKDMQAAGLPVWGINRPELLFWWVSEEQGIRKVLSDIEQNDSRLALSHFAEVYGVPVKFPLMDLRDQKYIKVSDLWGAYSEGVSKANQRYQLNSWVMGKNYYAQGKWHASWTMSVLGEKKAYRTSSSTIYRLQKTVMKHIAEVLAKEYSVVALEESRSVILEVSNVESLESFSELKRYLEQLFVVEGLEMKSIKGTDVSFLVHLKEDVEKFEKILRLDRKMRKLKVAESLSEVSQGDVSKREIDGAVQLEINEPPLDTEALNQDGDQQGLKYVWIRS
jgi:hypothetical protein